MLEQTRGTSQTPQSTLFDDWPSSCGPQTWPSTILVVSHDRNFLNAVATDIIHLHSQRLDGYRGDFETFIKSKQERLLNQQREYEAQQQYRQHIQVQE